jgi:hypothetical protein
VILRDKDSANCHQLKQTFIEMCEKAGRTDALIRIVCHELESWFLGDLSAVDKALTANCKKQVSKLQAKEKFRNPDAIRSAKQEQKPLNKK